MSTPPSPARWPVLGLLGIGAFALVGVLLLGLALFNLIRRPSAAPAASPTPLATQVVRIPTTTSSPPTATLAPTVEAPTAAPSATEAPAATATPALLVHITRPANVRTGPGLTYPAVGGLNTGETATASGRDQSAQWFAINFDGAPGGVGWVSVLVATYDGSLNDLPVIEAAAPPPASALPSATLAPGNTAGPTAPSATATQAVTGSHGIVSKLFNLEKSSVAKGEDIWFNFQVLNTTNSDVSYSVLAAHTDAGFTAKSWTNEVLKANQSLTWRDHLNINASGNYQVYLGICYAGKDACLTGGAAWDRLTPSINVTVN